MGFGVQGHLRDAPPVPLADHGAVGRIPQAAVFKVVLQTQFRCGWGPLRLLSLAQAKKNDQTFQQRQAIFFQKAALFQIAYKFQIKRVLRVQNRGKAQAVGAQG